MIDITPLLLLFLRLVALGQGLEMLAEQLNAGRIAQQNGKVPECAKILEMTGRAGVRVRGVDQMDATRRTRHTNANFAGLGWTRRIVLYDSLLSTHDHEEVLSVLAHESGHLKRRHIAKQLFIAGASTLAMFAAAGFLVSWPGLYTGFGFSGQAPYVGLFLAGILLQSLWVFTSPLSAAVSRRFEKEAKASGV
ncbi:MAG: M48 family metalloprotease [Desulfobacterales bacterium]|nr:M48 family metalloprotease [Desulfobacterales bacterium]